jgi:hypothetical protein
MLKPQIHSVLLWLFWRWSVANYLLSMTETSIFPLSASQVARIIDMSHQHQLKVFIKKFISLLYVLSFLKITLMARYSGTSLLS